MNIQIQGRQLHYIEQGKGQPVIFIHGGINDYRSWQFQIGPFSKKYRVISYSRRFAYPNRQLGNVVKDNTIGDNADDLAELIRKLELAPVHLVGHSYGAFTALYCAYRNPELVKTLVLGEPPVLPFLAKSHLEDDLELLSWFRDDAQRPAMEAFEREDDEKAIRAFVDEVMGKKNAFDQIPERARMLIMDNAKTLQGELESGMPTSFTIEDAKQVSIPTLLVVGELSPRFFHRIIEILSDNMPNTEQATIPGVTHDLGRATKPDILNAKVMEFLGKHA
ncbi:putative hydrolase or acyltransferase of alpha/beta superfamily [Candidatus Nitrososphaera evergladensis SR1]|uniref:Putative hydrolase or acyltransferase of alpha/beta superfamily n=1 Tax=Candidatus Nitrososphaera evergladensis SR1 TaxID=1459636 RepID=A0A075MWS3_9ARCH|nr:alpha/beta hydrolase [Candidatus Nitrososphaera evergladensis]AIF85097.1 putative hydrolase or acyltransferase of alpha/beta superfamily [Candidatus Nitrososphaera evergladensis SR1]